MMRPRRWPMACHCALLVGITYMSPGGQPSSPDDQRSPANICRRSAAGSRACALQEAAEIDARMLHQMLADAAAVRHDVDPERAQFVAPARCRERISSTGECSAPDADDDFAGRDVDVARGERTRTPVQRVPSNTAVDLAFRPAPSDWVAAAPPRSDSARRRPSASCRCGNRRPENSRPSKTRVLIGDVAPAVSSTAP